MKRIWFLSAIALAACGTDQGPSDGPTSGTVSGSISGTSSSGAASGSGSGVSTSGSSASGTVTGADVTGVSGTAAGASGTATGSDVSGTASGTLSGSTSGTVSGTASGSSTLDASVPDTSSSTADAGSDATVGVDSGPPSTATVGVLTNRYDNARSGANLNETILTQANVSGGKFGLLFSLPVDATVQAQPLIVSGVMVGGAKHNVAYVATENDSLYAFDADTGTQLWKQSLGTPFTTGNAAGDANSMVFGCQDLYPLAGINSTPAIDPATSTMYVVTKTEDSAHAAHQWIHALDIGTGMDKAGSPVEIKASVPGNGAGSSGGKVPFDPWIELSRPGLLIQGGAVYIAWASHCDSTMKPYHGWVMAYDKTSLSQLGAYCDTASGQQGGIWQSGMGITGDGTSAYFVSGNGDVDTTGSNATTANKGLTVGRLTLGATGGFTLADSYTAGNANANNGLNATDSDLTTAAVLGPGSKYLYMAGKDSNLRVIDSTNLGGYHAWSGGNDQDKVVQTIGLSGGHLHGGPVFWHGPKTLLFTWTESGPLKAFSVQANGTLSSSPVSQGNIGYLPVHPGAIMTVSSNGSMPGTGIVWASTVPQESNSQAAWHGIVPGRLYAFNAEDISKNLWNSTTNGADNMGNFAKFSPPVVYNGKVYIGTATTTNTVRVYGLKP